jgi:pyruvate,orthophosphate dikinase
MGKPCVVGCRALSVNSDEHRARLGDSRLAEGDWIAVDGGSGEVFLGQRKIVTEFPAADLEQLKAWRAGGLVPQVA